MGKKPQNNHLHEMTVPGCPLVLRLPSLLIPKHFTSHFYKQGIYIRDKRFQNEGFRIYIHMHLIQNL